MNRVISFILWLGIAGSIYLMAILILPYILPPFPQDIDFLSTKQSVIGLSHWIFSFYIHITSSLIVIFCGITQFSKYLITHKPQLHRSIGKLYVFLILFLAAPSGLIMGLYGNGGIYAQIGFVFQALFWGYFTYQALIKAIDKDYFEHGKFIFRSYAMTLSAISLRLGSYIVNDIKSFFEISCYIQPDHLLCYPNYYIFLAWFSWIINLLIAEIIIKKGGVHYFFKPVKI